MRKILLVFITAFLFISGCSVYQTISNVARLKYRIYSANEYKILGIPLADKKSVNDFNPIEILKLTSGLMKGNLPVTFVLNVEANNPNDGNGGYPRTDLSISSFPWRLYINDKETVTGDIANQVFVPGKGESVLIPIQVEFDLTKSFKARSLEDILALMLQIGGVKGSTSNLKIVAKPVLVTPVGKIQYPDAINIVDKTFN